MATIKTRRRKDGTDAFRVVWRAGGSRAGAWESETLHTRREAVRFCRDVDLSGQQWPEGWVAGVGYQAPPVVDLPVERSLPLAQFAHTYVRDLTGVTPATRARYDRMLVHTAAHLTAVLHETPTVDNITEKHVRRWVNARELAGARPKTIANYHGLLYAVMEAAVREGLRASNPCAGTRLPDRYCPDAEGDGDVVFLTEAQFGLLADAMFPATLLEGSDLDLADRRARAAPGREWAGDAMDRLLLQVAVGTGLRWSELTALQVQDLALDDPVPRLSVRRAWKRNPKGEFELPDQGPAYLGPPKTKKSRRRVSLSPAVVELLHRAAHGKTAQDLVLTAPQGGRLLQTTFHRDRWQVAVRRAQQRGLMVTPRFHDLRHTHAAWLISAGVPLPVIQQRLGHESITTTVDIYGGLLLQAHDVADTAIDAALRGTAVPAPRLHSAGAGRGQRFADPTTQEGGVDPDGYLRQDQPARRTARLP